MSLLVLFNGPLLTPPPPAVLGGFGRVAADIDAITGTQATAPGWVAATQVALDDPLATAPARGAGTIAILNGGAATVLLTVATALVAIDEPMTTAPTPATVGTGREAAAPTADPMTATTIAGPGRPRTTIH